ncbi:MAG: hypothetical protein SGJ18_15650 [Pseudomonadota bacterium]|nr:hypothetical protein [Pseudomonadota bacterium]
MKLLILNIFVTLMTFGQAQAADGDFHLKEIIPTAYMTEEDGFRLAEGVLFKKASQICGKIIAVRVTDFIASKPHPFSVSLEADFHCGI